MRRTSTIVRAGFLALSVAALATPSLAQIGAPAGSGGDYNPATGCDIYNLDRGGDYPVWGAPGGIVPPDGTTGSGPRQRHRR